MISACWSEIQGARERWTVQVCWTDCPSAAVCLCFCQRPHPFHFVSLWLVSGGHEDHIWCLKKSATSTMRDTHHSKYWSLSHSNELYDPSYEVHLGEYVLSFRPAHQEDKWWILLQSVAGAFLCATLSIIRSLKLLRFPRSSVLSFTTESSRFSIKQALHTSCSMPCRKQRTQRQWKHSCSGKKAGRHLVTFA